MSLATISFSGAADDSMAQHWHVVEMFLKLGMELSKRECALEDKRPAILMSESMK